MTAPDATAAESTVADPTAVNPAAAPLTAAGPARARLRARALTLGLWLIAACLAAREVAVVLTGPRGRRPADLETWVGPHGVLHVPGALYDSTRFTGTPFGGLVLRPLTRAAEQALGWGWTFGTLLLVAALGVIAARALPQPATARAAPHPVSAGDRARPAARHAPLPTVPTLPALSAVPVAISLLMLSLPVRATLWQGQTSVVPVLLVLLGCFVVRRPRVSGVLLGLAAALQPALLLFAPLLWCTGRRGAARSTGVTFAACTALAWAALPHDSAVYWVRRLAGAGLGGPADALANQSLHGALLRAGLTGPPEIALFLALGAVVAVAGVRRAVRYARDGQLLLAVAVTGCAALVISPTAWQHQLLWVLLTVVGRVGRRAADRYVWPVAVVLVMTLPARMLLPGKPLFQPLLENLTLLAALAAATAVPFLPRSSALFGSPLPTRYAAPVPARWKCVPLVPALRRALSRPNLLVELLLIRLTYWAYAQVRLAAAGGSSTGGRPVAERHGRQIQAIEAFGRIDVEHWVNHAVVSAGWPERFFSFYYESFHFGVPLAILGVLYWRRPVGYRWARSALGFATVLALAGFWLYPLAPPRLMPGLGIVDTVNGPQDFAKPDYGTLTELTNQYAAMPSLHFGWALWCGLVIALLAPKGWMKALGLLHPLLTLGAIVATGNHWVLDAAGGAAVVGAGFALTYLLQGPRPVNTALSVHGHPYAATSRIRTISNMSASHRNSPGPARTTRKRLPTSNNLGLGEGAPPNTTAHLRALG